MVSSVMKIVVGKDDIRQIIPKDLRDAKLKAFMYSTQEDPDKLMGVRKKRGRKPKASGSSS